MSGSVVRTRSRRRAASDFDADAPGWEDKAAEVTAWGEAEAALPLILVVIDEVSDIALQCGLRSAFYKNLIRLSSKGAAFGLILKAVPAGVQVQLANSSTVRYAQLFDMREENPVFCNRGTSGIEGSTSTAVGASVNSEDPVLLITGDLSFFYDTNGLWNSYLKPDFRIVVINNQGGGIFRILPGKEENPTFENYFETVQDRSIRAVCELYGLEHQKAGSAAELSGALETFFDPSQTPRLLEVKTPRKLNDAVLLGYFDFLSSALRITMPKTNLHE